MIMQKLWTMIQIMHIQWQVGLWTWVNKSNIFFPKILTLNCVHSQKD